MKKSFKLCNIWYSLSVNQRFLIEGSIIFLRTPWTVLPESVLIVFSTKNLNYRNFIY